LRYLLGGPPVQAPSRPFLVQPFAGSGQVVRQSPGQAGPLCACAIRGPARCSRAPSPKHMWRLFKLILN